MERRTLSHSFGPFYRPDSRILILGSFPSVLSREAGFYYAHPRNRFWQVLAALRKESVPGTTGEKEAFLARNGIAVYDVIERCSVAGSSDSSIRDAVPTDLVPILEESMVGDRIFTNGKCADRLYRRFQGPILGIGAVCLPSTSPANAAFGTERLIRIWGGEIGRVLPPP